VLLYIARTLESAVHDGLVCRIEICTLNSGILFRLSSDVTAAGVHRSACGARALFACALRCFDKPFRASCHGARQGQGQVQGPRSGEADFGSVRTGLSSSCVFSKTLGAWYNRQSEARQGAHKRCSSSLGIQQPSLILVLSKTRTDDLQSDPVSARYIRNESPRPDV